LWTTRAIVPPRKNRTAVPETPDRPRRTGQFALDFIIASAAIIVSLASLWVALRADQTQEQLLKSSVWPYLSYGKSNATEAGVRQLVFEIDNEGVGPALVRSIAVSYNGHYYPTFRSLMKACCNIDHPKNVFTSTLHDRVIVAHDSVAFIIMPPGKLDAAEYQTILAQRSKIEVKMCYCSVLGDCWFMDTSQGPGVPAAVRRCPPAQQPQYQT
jgi:hypothetical protein